MHDDLSVRAALSEDPVSVPVGAVADGAPGAVGELHHAGRQGLHLGCQLGGVREKVGHPTHPPKKWSLASTVKSQYISVNITMYGIYVQYISIFKQISIFQ